MGRPRKADDSLMVKLIDEFYESCGDPKKLKATRLEAFAKEQGHDIKEYDFRRSKAVQARIQELKDMHTGMAATIRTTSYKSLDVDRLISGCSSVDDLREVLLELDAYWKRVYSTASEHIAKSQTYEKERNSFLSGKAEMEKQLQALLEEKRNLQKENTRLGKENTYLRTMIRRYIYPAIVSEILKEHNTPDVAENTSVKPEMVSKMIEGKMPQPFSGRQTDIPKKPTRAESLIQSLKEQASRHE